MRVTIIRDDGVVGIDGVFRKVDLSGFPEDIHAVQWDGENGEVEFKGHILPNEVINDLGPYQIFISAWHNQPEELPNNPEVVPEDLPETNLRVDMTVTRFQALAALLQAGLLQQAAAYFETPEVDPLEKLAWESATNFYRLSPLVIRVGIILGLNDEQMDQLFIDAAAIEV